MNSSYSLPILFFLLVCIACLAEQTNVAKPSFPPQGGSTTQTPAGPQRDSFDAFNLVFQGISAIGTISVACLAIFGQRIRSWIVKPRLTVTVGDESPFVDTLEEEDASAPGSKRRRQQIRIEICNTGREIARNCTVFCGAIYKRKPNDSGCYPVKTFAPKQFFWTSSEQLRNIPMNMPSYVNIAEISDASSSTSGASSSSQGSNGPAASQVESLQILVEAEGGRGRFFRVDNGVSLIPITIYADNLSQPVKRVVEVFWEGHGLQDFSRKTFSIKLLNDVRGALNIGESK